MANFESIMQAIDAGNTDNYAIMGLTADATAAQIRTRYKECQVSLHPDKLNGEDKYIKAINNAYPVIYDAAVEAEKAAAEAAAKAAAEAEAQAAADLANNIQELSLTPNGNNQAADQETSTTPAAESKIVVAEANVDAAPAQFKFRSLCPGFQRVANTPNVTVSVEKPDGTTANIQVKTNGKYTEDANLQDVVNATKKNLGPYK